MSSHESPDVLESAASTVPVCSSPMTGRTSSLVQANSILHIHGGPACSRQYRQVHENDPAKVVLLCEPAASVKLANLHPRASLHMGAVTVESSIMHLRLFRRSLEQAGVHVFTIQEVLQTLCQRHRLEDLAMESLTYEMVDGSEDEFISNEYKRTVLRQKTREELIEVIFTRPVLRLTKSSRNTGVEITDFIVHPLGNLVFCRDPLITTARGIVLGRSRSQARSREQEVVKLVLETLEIPHVGEVPDDGESFLEGGDFFAMGPGLCLIGMGLRTSQHAVDYLLEHDLFGTDRVAMVTSPDDHDQQRMHLDTIFNVASDDTVFLLETVLTNPKHRRIVVEYTRGPDNKYVISRRDVSLAEYLQDNGFKLVLFTEKQQFDFAGNFLNVGNGKILAVHEEVKDRLPNCDVEYVPFYYMTQLYGAARCTSQVLCRERPSSA
eukprot:TRINITY_DN3703_c1_g1_i2.p1 TRINITY_DN3703_c1_g1~~TRINITY_DN3703_c1_g1_i2.p1  ORF type:complete len:437 (-),score=79.39 TRINITY_DN3703_c1_g1_i2:1560-2870(-)